MKVLDVQVTETEVGTSKTGRLADGTSVFYCHPHRRWEWDCNCGAVNSIRATYCEDCGETRNESAS